jgi:hypothetical protein
MRLISRRDKHSFTRRRSLGEAQAIASNCKGTLFRRSRELKRTQD